MFEHRHAGTYLLAPAQHGYCLAIQNNLSPFLLLSTSSDFPCISPPNQTSLRLLCRFFLYFYANVLYGHGSAVQAANLRALFRLGDIADGEP